MSTDINVNLSLKIQQPTIRKVETKITKDNGKQPKIKKTRVEKIKEEVKNGTYKLKMDLVANKIVDEYFKK